MASQDLKFLLVIVELFGSLAGPALALPENNGRRLVDIVGESTTPNPQSLWSGSIALHLNQQPKDITKGFVFGSDPRSCDVLLATNKEAGISASHFSVNVDWVSRDPMITCLSGNALQVRNVDTKETTNLSKKAWQRVKPGTTINAHVTHSLGVRFFIPSRGDLQAAYDHNLQDYFLEFKNAVPELANISLGDTEITPLILDRCDGLEGQQYFTTEMIETGDVDYDKKVFLYNAKCKPMPDALAVAQRRYEGAEGWILNESKLDRPGEICIVKHFRKEKVSRTRDRLRQLCHLSHLNLENVLDLIIEPSAFMVITSTFPHTTLNVLYQEEPLTSEEVGFVMGQTFAALKYLHDRGWAHGDLDPRSILVMSRSCLWIKLRDSALSDSFDLGKPDGYHATYASQKLFHQPDKSSADIWSAGVVALQLLNRLPIRTGASITEQFGWIKDLERFAKVCDEKSGTLATAAVRRILKHAPGARPTAAEVLKDPWLLRTRGDLFSLIDSHFNPPHPEVSRFTRSASSSSFSSSNGSASPIPVFSRDSEPPLPWFTDPPLPMFITGSSAPSQMTPAEVLERQTELEKLREDYYDLDNYDWSNVNPFGSSSVSSQSVDGGVQTPAIDWKTESAGPVGRQREVDIPDDSGEETETARRQPLTKKPRKGKGKAAVPPPHSMNLRSRGKDKT